MTDIDWSKAPEGATHYNDSGDHYPWERRHGDALSYVGYDGKWHELSEGGKFEWPEATPRPAQHRDWSDPAMWFDAPEWAEAVWLNKTERYYAYVGDIGDPDDIEMVKIDTGESASGYVEPTDGGDRWWESVATRPNQKQTIDEISESILSTIEITAASIESVGNTLGSAGDNVNHPQHYNQGAVECIDAIASATAGKNGIEAVCVANVVKYLWRYEEKNGAEDVKKAEWYLRKLLGHLNKS